MQVISPLLSYPALLAHFSGANNYTWVYFRNGKRQLLAKPLTYFEKQLPDFIRIHKIALINPAFVARVQPPPRPKMRGEVWLKDGTLLPISRRRWAAVRELLQPLVGIDPTLSVSKRRMDSSLPVQESMAHQSPPLRIFGILSGDALLLTKQCLNQSGLNCVLECGQPGAALEEMLRLTPAQEWPVLILVDARTEPAKCLQTVEILKRDAHLRAIPVIWLTAVGNSAEQAYGIDVNSVVVISEEPVAFVRTVMQLIQYWLFIVQSPF